MAMASIAPALTFREPKALSGASFFVAPKALSRWRWIRIPTLLYFDYFDPRDTTVGV